MRASAGLNETEALYREAALATARGSKGFYFATRFFPPDLARAAHSVYWFCRYTDDMVDEEPCAQKAKTDIDAWEADLAAGLEGSLVRHPVLRLFLGTVRQYEIPRRYPLDLIDGMRMDLAATRYRSFDELKLFCYRVASVVGLMMMHVIGFRGAAASYAVDLGIAMQLTNILRDVGEDLDRNRIYLPFDEMSAFGYGEDDLRRRVSNQAFRRLMHFQVERARSYYKAARPGMALLDPRGRFAVQVAAEAYRGILNRIEAADYDVFTRRAVVPTVRRYWIATRFLAAPAARRLASSLTFWRA